MSEYRIITKEDRAHSIRECVLYLIGDLAYLNMTEFTRGELCRCFSAELVSEGDDTDEEDWFVEQDVHCIVSTFNQWMGSLVGKMSYADPYMTAKEFHEWRHNRGNAYDRAMKGI